MELTKKKYSAQVFITTRNRLQTLRLTIASVLAQTRNDFEIIVSDNSTNTDTEKAIQSFTNERFSYRKRPNLGVIEHFNTILSEVKAENFMIFHDDDIMYPGMVEKLLDALCKNDQVAAVGANAYLNVFGKTTTKFFMRDAKADVLLANADQVVEHYYMRKNGIVPFPSYMYKKIVSDKLRFVPEHGMESCDVAFVMDITSLGNILMLQQPLMDYSLHGGQVSSRGLFQGQMKLIRYIGKQTQISRRQKEMKLFRIRAIYGELRDRLLTKKIAVFSRRYFKIGRLLAAYSPLEYFPKAMIITVLAEFRTPS